MTAKGTNRTRNTRVLLDRGFTLFAAKTARRDSFCTPRPNLGQPPSALSRVASDPRTLLHANSFRDAKLTECNAAWQARTLNGRAIRYMFVIDDAKPIEEILRCRGIVEVSVWPIWNTTGEDRVRLSTSSKAAAPPTVMGATP